LHAIVCSIKLSGMYSNDFDPDDRCLPPLELDDAAEPPPERDRPYGGVYLGSELGSVRFARDAGFVDLGQAVVDGFAAVQPGLVELARLGSTDFGVAAGHPGGVDGRLDQLPAGPRGHRRLLRPGRWAAGRV
jgi:hypothetical protein